MSTAPGKGVDPGTHVGQRRRRIRRKVHSHRTKDFNGDDTSAPSIGAIVVVEVNCRAESNKINRVNVSRVVPAPARIFLSARLGLVDRQTDGQASKRLEAVVYRGKKERKTGAAEGIFGIARRIDRTKDTGDTNR